jgi:hypothetical protein
MARSAGRGTRGFRSAHLPERRLYPGEERKGKTDLRKNGVTEAVLMLTEALLVVAYCHLYLAAKTPAQKRGAGRLSLKGQPPQADRGFVPSGCTPTLRCGFLQPARPTWPRVTQVWQCVRCPFRLSGFLAPMRREYKSETEMENA